MKHWTRAVVFAVTLMTAMSAAAAEVTAEQAEASYAQWLQFYADRTPELAIAMTSDDFTMVNNETVMNREEALAFVLALRDFILSRQCENAVVANQPMPEKGRLLLSRVDCVFQTVLGPLEASFLETVIWNKHGEIVYDHFSDVADGSL